MLFFRPPPVLYAGEYGLAYFEWFARKMNGLVFLSMLCKLKDIFIQMAQS